MHAESKGVMVTSSSQPERVCALLFNPFTHDSRVLKECRSLASFGYDVTLLAFHNPGLPEAEEVGGFHVRRVPTWTRRFLPKHPVFHPAKMAEVWLRFLVRTLRLRPAVIHCHEVLPLLVAIPASLLTGAHLIYDSHELYFARPGMGGFRRWFSGWLEAWGLHRAKAVITPLGGEFANAIRKRHPHCPETVVLYNCPDTSRDAGADGRALRLQLGLPVDGYLVLYVGAVQERRGLEESLHAVAKSPANVHLVIMGTLNEAGHALSRLAEELGCADRFHWIGPFPPDQVSHYAQACDAGLVLIQNSSLSYYLSLPTKLFEYMAARLPVIASDFPEIRRVVVDPDQPVGLVVNPTDPAAIAEAFRWMQSHPAEVARFGENGRRRIEEFYNWGRQEQTLAQLYQRILESNRDSCP